ncbi:GGDEF domain-containing protein [Dyella sp. 20L07]|uniref:GGDEF domain-containing protein n=1 Tax=Dyella sp. 20L07 TaxID=3384240 RepID=UPI003D285CE5
MSLDIHRERVDDEVPGFDVSLLVGPLAASLQQLYESIPAALGVIGRDGLYLAANTAYAAILGAAPQELIGRAVAEYLPEADEQLHEDFQRFDAGIGTIEREVACRGSYYLVALQPVRDADDVVQGVTSVLIDITARKRMEQALERARRHWQFHASHDHLTGLPNRRHIDEVVLAEASRCVRSGTPLSVLMIDVDYFKKFNDHAGHQRGDECLRLIAAQLQARMRRHGDLVGRYGGEEFIAILPGTDSAGAYRVAQGVLEDVRALSIGHPASPYGCVTLSVGVATLSDTSGRVSARCNALLGHADRALYSAKAAGRNAACIHPPRQ